MCSQTRFTDERRNLGKEERNSGLTTEAERQDDTPGPSPQSFAAMKGTNLEADIANAAAVVNGPVGCKITNNQDNEQPLRQNLGELEGKLFIEGRKIHDQKNNVISIESQIKELDKTLEQHYQDACANVENRRNIRGQMEGLKEELGSRIAELSRLEGEVLPQLMAQRDEVKYQLQKHSNNTKEKVDGIPALEKKLKNLTDKLEQYHNDVSSVREEVSKLSRLISKLETEFRNQTAEIQKLRDVDLKGIKQQLRDEMTAREASDRENQKLHDEIKELEKQLKEEVNKRSGSDLRKQVDEDLFPGGDVNIEVGGGDSLGGDANRLENYSARHRLWIIKEEMKWMTTALQQEVEDKWKLRGKLPRILNAVLEELDQEPKAAEILERYIEQTCNQCTNDDQVNTTGSDANSKGYKRITTKCDANSRGDKGGGVTTSTSGGGKARSAELQESGHNIRLPPDTGCHQTLNDIDKLRMIQEEFNNMTADFGTNLKVEPGTLLTLLEAVLRYPEQERKESGSNSCCPPHSGPRCDQNIDKLGTILEEMKTKTTDLQKAVENKFQLPPGILPDILDKVLKCQQNQAPKAAGLSEIRGRSPPLLGDDMANRIENQLVLKTGSLHEIIHAVLKFGQKKKWWEFWNSNDASTRADCGC